MPSPPSIHTSLYSIPSVPGTPTSFESTGESFAGRGPKVLNGRLVKSKPRQPAQSTSGRSLPPSTLGSPSEGMDEYDDDVNRDNDNDNQNGHLNAAQEPQKHSTKDSRVKPASGNKIWNLMKRISTGGLRDKYALHSPSSSMSSPASGGGGGGGPTRSLSRAAQLRMTKLSNYSEESLACSHRSHGSYGSLVASSSHTSHGEPALLPSPGFNYDHAPPPVPAIPAAFSSSEPGSNISRKQHRRDRDSRSASSPIPSISSPLSPGQYSSASHSSATSSSSPHTPSPSPSAPGKKRILSRISSMGLLRRKPSIASGLASSLGFGASGTLDKAEKMENNNNNGGALAVQEVPASFTIPTIPSTPLKSKSTKYSISCIPIPSIPSMPSMSIIASSTPIRSTAQISFSSSSSRPGTAKTTLSQSSSASSPRLSLDSRSRTLAISRRSKSTSRSRSRSNSLDSLGHDDHVHHTTPKKKISNYDQDRDNHRNNSHNHNMPATTTLYPLAKHIVPPLELSATLDDSRWGIEHVISGDDDQASSSSVSLPIDGSLSYPEGCRSVGPGLGPKRVNRTINSEKVNKREDKWERLLERRDKLELDKLDGLRSRSIAVHGRGRESWTIAHSPEEELPSLPVPPRKRTKERESRKEKEKEPSRDERSASVDVPASPVSSSPVYRGRAIVDDIPAPSTFGRVMGKQIGEGSMEETRRSSLSPIQGRASFSVAGDDGRKKNGRDGSRKRRSLSAARSPSVLVSSPDSQTVPSPRSWTKSLSSPILRKNSKNAAVVSTATPPAAATPPRALGTLFRKLSFSGVSASGMERRRNRSPRRPSTASSSVPSAKARSGSISGGGKSGVFWNGDNSKQGELETLPLLPRRLLRKNSLLKGRGNQDMPRTRRPRTADASSSGTLTEKEKRERWENLLERSEKAGGTIHLRANGEGLLSDRMRMSMVSTTSGVGVQEESVI